MAVTRVEDQDNDELKSNLLKQFSWASESELLKLQRQGMRNKQLYLIPSVYGNRLQFKQLCYLLMIHERLSEIAKTR